MKTFKQNPNGSNELLYIDENNFFSYNPCRNSIFANSIFGSDNNSDETALALKKNEDEILDSDSEYNYIILKSKKKNNSIIQCVGSSRCFSNIEYIIYFKKFKSFKYD